MSQAADYDVANASGASVRADLNTILLAIATKNAGTAAPSTTYANMDWVDTTNSLWKKRNNANSSWIQLGPMDNRLEGRVPINTQSSGYTAVAADRETLIRFTTAGVTLGFTAAATLGADWFCYVRNSAASGVVTLDPSSTEQIDGATTITLQPGESCAVICNGTSFETVGRTGTTITSTATGALQTLVSTDAGASEGPDLDLYRNSASPAASDVIGGIQFNGQDSGAAKQLYARIRTVITDPTAASEDAKVVISTVVAGAETDVVTVEQAAAKTGLYVAGNPVTLPLLQTLTASSSASLNFTGADNTKYRGYLCIVHRILPATNGADLLMRASTDQGSTLRSGAEYGGAKFGFGSSGGTAASAQGTTALTLAPGISNTGRGAHGTVHVLLGTAAYDFQVLSRIAFTDGATPYIEYLADGQDSTASINGFGFLMSSGNITSGTITVYGIPKV